MLTREPGCLEDLLLVAARQELFTNIILALKGHECEYIIYISVILVQVNMTQPRPVVAVQQCAGGSRDRTGGPRRPWCVTHSTGARAAALTCVCSRSREGSSVPALPPPAAPRPAPPCQHVTDDAPGRTPRCMSVAAPRPAAANT